MKWLICVSLSVLFASGSALAEGNIFGSSSVLSTYDRDLIRKPVKGSLHNAPRTPRVVLEEQTRLSTGVTLDIYAPGLYGNDTFGNGPYQNMARTAARRYGIPVSLFMKLVKQESNWKPNARSHKGAMGLAQLMPATARYLGVDPSDPRQNLDGGARYLAEQYRRFRSWHLALAAYNAGPEAVQRHNGIPPYRETQNYVKVIMGN